jgi:hypothetical protein
MLGLSVACRTLQPQDGDLFIRHVAQHDCSCSGVTRRCPLSTWVNANRGLIPSSIPATRYNIVGYAFRRVCPTKPLLPSHYTLQRKLRKQHTNGSIIRPLPRHPRILTRPLPPTSPLPPRPHPQHRQSLHHIAYRQLPHIRPTRLLPILIPLLRTPQRTCTMAIRPIIQHPPLRRRHVYNVFGSATGL